MADVREVTLRPVTGENRPELETLSVSLDQLAFVGSVADAFAEAQEDPDGRAICSGCTTARRRWGS